MSAILVPLIYVPCFQRIFFQNFLYIMGWYGMQTVSLSRFESERSLLQKLVGVLNLGQMIMVESFL